MVPFASSGSLGQDFPLISVVVPVNSGAVPLPPPDEVGAAGTGEAIGGIVVPSVGPTVGTGTGGGGTGGVGLGGTGRAGIKTKL